MSERGSTTTIPVAAHPIAVGATVNAGDTRIVTVHSSDTGVLSGILPVSSVGAGWVATVPIVAGDPITRSEVARAASGTQGLGAMSVPAAVADADGGQIVAGDLVDVISMNSTGGGPQYVAQGLRVLSVAPPSSSSGVLTTGNGDYYVVVAVDRPTALRVASALAAGSAGNSSGVLVVRTTGETPTPTTGGSS
ncbi:MAG: hypothetical protein ACRDZ8_16035 [Acidimicrobiales bacterium]